MAVWALCALLALRPPMPRRSSPSNRTFWLTHLVNELPVVLVLVVLTSTLQAGEDLGSPGGRVGLALGLLTVVAAVLLVRRVLRARPVLGRALDDGLGAGWSAAVPPDVAARLRTRPPWPQVLLRALPLRPRAVEKIRNIQYGDAGPANLLDVYRHRSRPAGAPVLVHLHGGAFRSGRKSWESRALFHRLASRGWVCVSANYRLSPRARFPEPLVDVKKVLAWVRECGRDHGADPGAVMVGGSSAGGHLASMAALTANDPVFQPGFEEDDTSVTAVVSLYGYYGRVDSDPALPSSPGDHVGQHAPPFLVVHGDKDTVVLVRDARSFVSRLASRSRNPVVYAELPGAQHVFDLFRSGRFEAVVDAVEAFGEWVLARRVAVHGG